MKNIWILGFCIALFSCAGNHQEKETSTDTVTGSNIKAKSQQSSVDTNANKIGNDRKPDPDK